MKRRARIIVAVVFLVLAGAAVLFDFSKKSALSRLQEEATSLGVPLVLSELKRSVDPASSAARECGLIEEFLNQNDAVVTAYRRHSRNSAVDGDHPLPELVKDLSPLIELVRSMSKKPHCDRLEHTFFTGEFESGCPSTHRNVAKILGNRALLQAHGIQPGDPFETLAWGAANSRFLREKPLLIGSLVHISVEALWLSNLKEVLEHSHRSTDIRAATLLLPQLGLEPDFKATLKQELAFARHMIRFDTGALFDENLTLSPPTFGDKVARGFLTYPTLPKMIEESLLRHGLELVRNLPDSPNDYDEHLAAIKVFDARLEADWLTYYLSSLAPVYSAAAPAFTKLIATRRMTRVLLASLKHRRAVGIWPAEIPDLGVDSTDPFTNKPLKFAFEGRSLLIYSVGPDQGDDKGISQADAQRAGQSTWDVPLHFELK